MTASELLGRVVSDDPAVLNFCHELKKFNIKFVDQSVKIKQGSVNSERVLVYIPAHKVNFTRLWDVVWSFGFPLDLRYELQSNYYKSKNIGICLEKNGDKNNYRIYTEYHLAQKQYMQLLNDMVFKHKTVDSYKWNSDDPESMKKTYYESLLTPNYDNIKLAMHMANVKYVPQALNRKLKGKPADEFIGTYFVTDNNTNRSALDIKFDDGDEFYLSDFAKELTDWSRKNIETRLQGLDKYPIHHVSLGVDADEKDYVTLYFKL